MIRETVVRNGNLRAEFFRNIWMVEKVRKHFDLAEVELFRKVYTEGKEAGESDSDNVDLVADMTHDCSKGLQVPYIYGRIAHGMKEEDTKPQVAKVVYGALGSINKRIITQISNYGIIRRKDSADRRCCTQYPEKLSLKFCRRRR